MKVKFKESISSMIGSFARDEIAVLDTPVAEAWLKSGTVELVEPPVAAISSPVEALVVEASAPAPSPAPVPAPKTVKGKGKK